MALYMVSLEHAPERCPGVDLGVGPGCQRLCPASPGAGGQGLRTRHTEALPEALHVPKAAGIMDRGIAPEDNLAWLRTKPPTGMPRFGAGQYPTGHLIRQLGLDRLRWQGAGPARIRSVKGSPQAGALNSMTGGFDMGGGSSRGFFDKTCFNPTRRTSQPPVPQI